MAVLNLSINLDGLDPGTDDAEEVAAFILQCFNPPGIQDEWWDIGAEFGSFAPTRPSLIAAEWGSGGSDG